MGQYRASDLLLAPSLISLTRIPLAAAFVLALTRPALELVILVVAGATDVLDGWWARRYQRTTATGSVVDPVTDKLFVLSVVVSLVYSGRLDLASVVLLSTRELGELPLVVWWTLSRSRRRARASDPKANVPGKMATSTQFVAVALALFRSPLTVPAVWLAAGLGVIAAASYWGRELAEARGARGSG